MQTEFKKEKTKLELENQAEIDVVQTSFDKQLNQKKQSTQDDIQHKFSQEELALKQKINKLSAPGGMKAEDLQEQKLACKQELDEQMFQKKRELERESREKMKGMRSDYQTMIEKAKSEMKAKLQAEHDRQVAKLEHELADVSVSTKRKCEEQTEQQAYVLEAKKSEVEASLKADFERDKKDFQETQSTEGMELVKQTITYKRRIVY